MHYLQAKKKILSGKIANVYLLIGEDDFLKRSFLHDLSTVLKNKTGRAVSLEKLESFSSAHLNLNLNQGSLVKTNKIFLINSLPYAEKRGQDSIDDIILTQLQKQNTEAFIVFLAEKADRRRKTVRAIDKQGGVVEFSPLKGESLLLFLKDICQQKNLTPQKDALEELVFRKGENLSVLVHELEKLAVYLGSSAAENALLTKEAVEKSCCLQQEGNIFHLADAVGKKQASRALRLLKAMLQQKEPPLLILFMLSRHYRLLYQALTIPEGKKGPSYLASKLGIPRHVAASLLEQAKTYTLDTIAASFLLLEEADGQIKKGLKSEEAALELLILKLTLLIKAGSY